MLLDSIHKAFDVADRMVDRARAAQFAKAASSGDQDILAGSPGMPGDPRQQGMGSARAQYAAIQGLPYNAIRLVASRVAGQRLCVASDSGPRTRKATDYDNLEPLESHPLLDVINNPGVPLRTRWALIFCTTASIQATGRSLWWLPLVDGQRRVKIVPSDWILKETEAGWKVNVPGSGTTPTLPHEETCHLYYPDPSNPWTPMSPMQRLARSIDADEAIQESQRVAFKNSINPGLGVRVGKRAIPGLGELARPQLTSTQRQQIITAIEGHYAGVAVNGKPLILDGLIEDVFQIFRSPQEMSYLDSGKTTQQRIYQGFGTSPILMGDPENANRASATVADEILCACAVNPLLEMLSQSLTVSLAPMFAQGSERLTVWFERAVPRDPDMQFRKWSLAAARGLCTLNEYRRNVLNLPDISGGDELIQVGGAVAAAAAEAVKSSGLEHFITTGLNPYTLKALRDGKADGG